MQTIVCHPDNWEALKATIASGQSDYKLADFQVLTNPNMARDKPTGRYVLPNGRAVAKENVVIKERFVEYGPEDVEWLVYAGVIAKEREMLFCAIDDLMFRINRINNTKERKCHQQN